MGGPEKEVFEWPGNLLIMVSQRLLDCHVSLSVNCYAHLSG